MSESDDEDFNDPDAAEQDDDGGGGDSSFTANPLTDGAESTVGVAAGLVLGVAGGQAGAGPDDDDISPTERPDVDAPMQWFATGVWAKLDEPLVVWGLRAVYVGLGNGGWGWFLSVVGTSDTNGLIFVIGGFVCAEAFAFALEDLRDLVRPQTGGLGQLATAARRDQDKKDGDAATPPTIKADAFDSLARWRKGTYGFAAVWCGVLGMGMIPFVWSGPWEGIDLAGFMSWILWFTAVGPLFAAWYMTLRLACALGGEGVEQLADAVSTPAAATMSTADWNVAVKTPAIALAEITMPALSQWGRSAAAIGGGLCSLGLGLLNMGMVWGFPPFMVMAGMVFSAALALVLVPAGVSTECESMIGTLNKLRQSADYRTEGHISQLESLLQGFNRGQGIGFKVFGAVVNRQQLKVLFAKTWAILVALYLFLEPLLRPSMGDLTDLDAAASSRLCEPGWYHADKSCYRIFGDVEEADWKTWPDAEASCQEFGGSLASVTSPTQHGATLALADGLMAWIGLSDFADEGNFVWSDGEALEFTQWSEAEGQPNNAVDAMWGYCEGGEDCAALGPYEAHTTSLVAWVDNPCSLGRQYFENNAHNRDRVWSDAGEGACVEFRLPFICSKPSTPPAAHGGLMHGCKNGGWIMGTPHNNTDLPPTIVRFNSLADENNAQRLC